MDLLVDFYIFYIYKSKAMYFYQFYTQKAPMHTIEAVFPPEGPEQTAGQDLSY